MTQPHSITSAQNPRVKDAVRLRERRHRRLTGRIVIDGAREIARAIAAGVKLRELFVCEELCRSDDAHAVLDRPESETGTSWSVTPEVFSKLAFGDRHEGLVAVADTPERAWSELEKLPTEVLVAVLETIEKPGNLGAVCRTADAAGLAAMLIADPATDIFNPNAIRASAGTVFSLPVFAAPATDVLAWLRGRGFRILAARVGAPMLYTAADYRGPTAIVLGSEAAGLSEAWSAADITAIQLPMRGQADSLNVSVTAGILFYEALRQRSG
jgi:TrmH family RNA methyltransferase